MASMMISLSRKLSSKFIKPSFSSCISSHFISQDPKFDGFAHYSSSIFTQQTTTEPQFSFLQKCLNITKVQTFPQTIDLKLKEITLTNTLLNNQNSREFSTSGSSSKPDISAFANETRDEWRKHMKHQYDAIKLKASVTFGWLGLGNLICYNIIDVIPELKPLGYAFAILNVWFISSIALHAKSLAKNHKMVEEEIKRLEEEGCEEGLADILHKAKATNLRLVEFREVFLTDLRSATAAILLSFFACLYLLYKCLV